jgi:hypothetical protein
VAEVAQLINGFLKSKFKIVYCYMFVRIAKGRGYRQEFSGGEEGAQKFAG